MKADNITGNTLTVMDKFAPVLPTPEKSKTPSTPKENLPQQGSEEKKFLYAELSPVSGSKLAYLRT